MNSFYIICWQSCCLCPTSEVHWLTMTGFDWADQNFYAVRLSVFFFSLINAEESAAVKNTQKHKCWPFSARCEQMSDHHVYFLVILEIFMVKWTETCLAHETTHSQCCGLYIVVPWGETPLSQHSNHPCGYQAWSERWQGDLREAEGEETRSNYISPRTVNGQRDW